MAERPDTLLDLSDWPAAPAPPPRTGLPPRPPRGGARRSLPGLSLTATGMALAALGLGLLLLLVPLGGCGSSLGAWAADPLPVPSDVPPALDSAETARDASAVARAQAALAGWHPVTTPAPGRAQSASTRTTTVSDVDPQEVAAAQAAVDAAQRDATAAQHELDRLLAQQEAADDPGEYDGQVAAAREELDRAVANLDEDRRALAVARARTRTVTVTTTASPRPAATAQTAAAPAARTALVAQLADAKQVQAAHLAQRAQVVADWRDSHEEQVTRVSAHNAQVRSCADRAAVPASGGAGLVVLGGGLLLRRRFLPLLARRFTV
ncbi:MAG TPA: hypothetical protein VM097_07645 [Mycobacteriales bacterium]|nr:hypothetical protein [Mycobacteriales bacterium]